MKRLSLVFGIALITLIIQKPLRSQEFNWNHVPDNVFAKCEVSLIPNIDLSRAKLVSESRISVFRGNFYYRRYKTPDTSYDADFDLYENVTNFSYFKAIISIEAERFFLCRPDSGWHEVRDIGFSIDGSGNGFMIQAYYNDLQ